MWIEGTYSRRGFGLIAEDTINSALPRARKEFTRWLNAAELDSALTAKRRGLNSARISLHFDHIQQKTLLDIAGKIRPGQFARDRPSVSARMR
jgi:hypothetical protein